MDRTEKIETSCPCMCVIVTGFIKYQELFLFIEEFGASISNSADTI